MIHIYFGDGKGKTTAATGLAVRAAGCGKRVLICRFLKDNDSGELCSFKELPNITVLDSYGVEGFLCDMQADKRKRVENEQAQLFDKVCEQIKGGEYSLAVLDEALWLMDLDIISEDRMLEFLNNVPSETEIVLTGGHASEKLINRADYVTCMKKICHPYDLGCAARHGIEY